MAIAPSRRRLTQTSAIATAVVTLLLTVSGCTTDTGARPDFNVWLDAFRQDALAQGIRPQTLDRTLTGLEPVASILERDRNQPEFTLSFQQYRDRIVTPETVEKGRGLLRSHAAVLAEIARVYDVPGQIVVAIWGIESRFGERPGSAPAIAALATLAYDARRPDFFRRELIAALRIIERGDAKPEALVGSWAGALGQPQFMPSSYLAFAQDFDGDQRRDIWNNSADVFASIANYLAKNGWRGGHWGGEVKVPDDIASLLPGLARIKKSGCSAIDHSTIEMTAAEWHERGVDAGSGESIRRPDDPLSLVRPDRDAGPSFLVNQNYGAILRYNCSHHYALTVAQLADLIAAGEIR